MDALEALNVLGAMADRAPGNGADHRAAGEAYLTLKALVDPGVTDAEVQGEDS